VLLQHGRALMKSAVQREGGLLSNALHLLKTHVLLGSGRLIPAELLAALERHFGSSLPLNDEASPVLAHLVRLWLKQPPATSQDLAAWTSVLKWLQEAGIPRRFNAVQRRLGLDYLVRRAAAWQVFKHQRYLASQRPLYVWHEPIVQGGWELTFLRTRHELRQEAESLNCFEEQFIPKAGYDSLFARVMHNGVHIGRAHFWFGDGRWYLGDAHGQFFEPLCQNHHEALVALAKRIRKPVYNFGGQP